jgi:hypothetical protein
MAIVDELLELERRGWDSLCDGTGDQVYGDLMQEGALMVLAHGEVFDRDTVVRSLAQAPPWDRYEILEERVVPIGSEAAALVYVGRAYRGDDTTPAFEGPMSSVYVRDGDGWRLALYQQTRKP